MYYLYRGKRAKNKVEFTEVSFLLSSENLEDLIHFINEDDNRKGLPEITEHSFVNGIYEFTNRNDRDIIYRIINDKENLREQFVTFSYVYSKLNTYESIFPILKIDEEQVYYIADTFFDYEHDDNYRHRLSSTHIVKSIRKNREGFPILSDTKRSAAMLIYFRFGIDRHPKLYNDELDLDELSYSDLLSIADYESALLDMIISNIEPLMEYQKCLSKLLINCATKLGDSVEEDNFDENKMFLFRTLLKINKTLNKK